MSISKLVDKKNELTLVHFFSIIPLTSSFVLNYKNLISNKSDLLPKDTNIVQLTGMTNSSSVLFLELVRRLLAPDPVLPDPTKRI